MDQNHLDMEQWNQKKKRNPFAMIVLLVFLALVLFIVAFLYICMEDENKQSLNLHNKYDVLESLNYKL